MPEEMRGLVDMLSHPPAYNGAMAAYRRQWLGKIVERYRSGGGGTRLIFVRLPRSQFSPTQPSNPNASVRQWAREPHVTLIDEHYFDSLEKPELIMDPLHLNKADIELFSIALSDEVRRILEKP